ncbi:MAG: hypothetical protein K2O15_06610 [Lachnospiraceae bacterium]|nr:hypothetical protein [Lachnospiraceae bacterium]
MAKRAKLKQIPKEAPVEEEKKRRRRIEKHPEEREGTDRSPQYRDTREEMERGCEGKRR